MNQFVAQHFDGKRNGANLTCFPVLLYFISLEKLENFIPRVKEIIISTFSSL